MSTESINLRNGRVAVIGAGAAGLTLAGLLAERGVAVELFEAEVDVSSGSGITLQANALRVLREFGVWEPVAAAGFGFDTTGTRLPDAEGRLVAELTEGRFDPGLPATLGMRRSDLAAILADRAVALGVDLQRGVRVTGVSQDGAGVELELETRSGPTTTRRSRRFDLVVAADGINSTVRALVGIATRPTRIPLGVWRFIAPRPSTVTRLEAINGGTAYFAGYAPISATEIYGWLVEDAADHRSLDDRGKAAAVRTLAAGYHGPWDEICSSLEEGSAFNYTVYSELLVPLPWFRGRVVLIGDAVHACPPTMAQGAAQALEDASVLAEILTRAPRLAEDDLAEFGRRRLNRVRSVVEGSVQIARWQLDHERGDVPALMQAVSRLLAQPA